MPFHEGLKILRGCRRPQLYHICNVCCTRFRACIEGCNTFILSYHTRCDLVALQTGSIPPARVSDVTSSAALFRLLGLTVCRKFHSTQRQNIAQDAHDRVLLIGNTPTPDATIILCLSSHIYLQLLLPSSLSVPHIPPLPPNGPLEDHNLLVIPTQQAAITMGSSVLLCALCCSPRRRPPSPQFIPQESHR